MAMWCRSIGAAAARVAQCRPCSRRHSEPRARRWRAAKRADSRRAGACLLVIKTSSEDYQGQRLPECAFPSLVTFYGYQ